MNRERYVTVSFDRQMVRARYWLHIVGRSKPVKTKNAFVRIKNDGWVSERKLLVSLTVY
jgi:hypothetical protein